MFVEEKIGRMQKTNAIVVSNPNKNNCPGCKKVVYPQEAISIAKHL